MGGILKWFDKDQSEGVIEFVENSSMKFIHVASEDLSTKISSNERVKFEIVEDRKFGKKARNIEPFMNKEQKEQVAVNLTTPVPESETKITDENIDTSENESESD